MFIGKGVRAEAGGSRKARTKVRNVVTKRAKIASWGLQIVQEGGILCIVQAKCEVCTD